MHQAAGASSDAGLAGALHARANAARWHLPVEVFAEALDASARQAFGDRQPSAIELKRYLSSLRLDDLALACACAAGDDAAWEHFIKEHRPGLYRAADAIDPTGGARDLADALYADLFGLGEHQGRRQSLFRYFHGRSTLGTWLRAVLSQRHVDRIRATRRLAPLPDDDTSLDPAATDPEADAAGARLHRAMHAALAAALAGLASGDRLLVGLYYAQRMKLAAIGRMRREHEATVSRHLTRVRREIRAGIERSLRDAHGFDEGAVAECFAAVAGDSGSLDLAAMLESADAGKNRPPDRSRDRRNHG